MTEITKLRNVCENNTKQVQIFLKNVCENNTKQVQIFFSYNTASLKRYSHFCFFYT